jgi:hypothetical protein
MVDTLNHPDLPLSPTRWHCLPAPETLMIIRKAKLLPRDEVGWISRDRLDSGRCPFLFLDIPFYRTQNPCFGHFECNDSINNVGMLRQRTCGILEGLADCRIVFLNRPLQSRCEVIVWAGGFPPALLQAEVLYRSGGSKPEAMRVLESSSKADHLFLTFLNS